MKSLINGTTIIAFVLGVVLGAYVMSQICITINDKKSVVKNEINDVQEYIKRGGK